MNSTHMSESRHTEVSHGTHMGESCHTYEYAADYGCCGCDGQRFWCEVHFNEGMALTYASDMTHLEIWHSFIQVT